MLKRWRLRERETGRWVEGDQKETGFRVHRWDLRERALVINATTTLVPVASAHAWPSSNTYASPLLLLIHTIQFKYVPVCLREIHFFKSSNTYCYLYWKYIRYTSRYT
jgi:hypothetical protein